MRYQCRELGAELLSRGPVTRTVTLNRLQTGDHKHEMGEKADGC